LALVNCRFSGVTTKRKIYILSLAMKNMKRQVLLLALLGIFVFSLVFASAGRGLDIQGDVVLKAVPEQTNWIADGTTEYEVKIYADNTGLNGEQTKAAEWKLMVPSGLDGKITMTSAQWPTQNDFFEGFSIFFQSLGINWNLHGKLVNGGGPANKVGVLAVYKFKVNPGFTGQTSFDFYLEETGFCSGGLEDTCIQQPYHVEIVPFTVSKKPPVATGPGTPVSATDSDSGESAN